MEKIKKLKLYFIKEKIDGYIVPKNDEFFGEYIPKHNDRLNFISNFTGSYGFALILKRNNYLFVDGRYTLQAKIESGKYFKIITIPKKMPNDILKNKKMTIGFDPKLFTRKSFETFFGKSNCKFKPLDKNLIDSIWKRKIKKSKNNFYVLPKNSVSENYTHKIKKILNYLEKVSAEFIFISASENNAWLFNIRGRDTEFSPIPNSYVLINKNRDIKFFCDLNKISPSFKKYFSSVQFVDINLSIKFYQKLNKKKFIIDNITCSYHFEKIISKNNKILKFKDPIYLNKAIKGKKEIENIKAAHISDGIALTKYLFWLKKISTKQILQK